MLVVSSLYCDGKPFLAPLQEASCAVAGAVLGMTVVGAGAGCVRWGYPGLLAIVASWFASPVLAGVLSALMLVCIKYGVLKVCSYQCSTVTTQVTVAGHRFCCSDPADAHAQNAVPAAECMVHSIAHTVSRLQSVDLAARHAPGNVRRLWVMPCRQPSLCRGPSACCRGCMGGPWPSFWHWFC